MFVFNHCMGTAAHHETKTYRNINSFICCDEYQSRVARDVRGVNFLRNIFNIFINCKKLF